MTSKQANERSHVSQGETIQYPTNRILAASPPSDLQRLTPHLVATTLTFKRSLLRPWEPITEMCFPDSGVCSVMSVMRNGATAEVATIGNEGVTGLPLFFGDTTDPSELLIQVPGKGRMLPAEIFQEELARNPARQVRHGSSDYWTLVPPRGRIPKGCRRTASSQPVR